MLSAFLNKSTAIFYVITSLKYKNNFFSHTTIERSVLLSFEYNTA